MNGEFWKKSHMYFSEIFTGRVIFRRAYSSWSAESTNLGIFLKAWIAFFFLSQVVSGERIKKNSKNIPKCSFHWDLSTELFNVEFRALGGPKLLFLWLFACSSRVFPRFLHFKNRFWRRVRRKNSRKNSKCSSPWDLSIELFNVEFRALEGLESRFLWHFCKLKSRFSKFKRRFWRRVWRKNSEKKSTYSSHWDLSIQLLNVEFRALGGPESHVS